MSESDLHARPFFHHMRQAIGAHLALVFAALAFTRWIEDQTGWSIKEFVRNARRCRTVEMQAGEQTITAKNRCLTTPVRVVRSNRLNLAPCLELARVTGRRAICPVRRLGRTEADPAA